MKLSLVYSLLLIPLATHAMKEESPSVKKEFVYDQDREIFQFSLNDKESKKQTAYECSIKNVTGKNKGCIRIFDYINAYRKTPDHIISITHLLGGTETAERINRKAIASEILHYVRKDYKDHLQEKSDLPGTYLFHVHAPHDISPVRRTAIHLVQIAGRASILEIWRRWIPVFAATCNPAESVAVSAFILGAAHLAFDALDRFCNIVTHAPHCFEVEVKSKTE